MNKEVLATSSTKQTDELCEDIEVVGPGLMLSEARKKMSLSIEDVSKKLNFRSDLVNEIEQDIFSQSLPATFNRGYLRNYAKLVSIDVDEVLSAYDMLGVAEKQRNEMQSFSNLTVKQAEHSRLMWFSYLIVALLVGLVVMWWLQDTKLSLNVFNKPKLEQKTLSYATNITKPTGVDKGDETVALPQSNIIETKNLPEVSEQKNLEPAISGQKSDVAHVSSSIENPESELTTKAQKIIEKAPGISTVVFAFSGDCWVNIYDATGERIAWGVKKSGYVMTTSGKAPLKVTLGKPELAVITFNGKQVDMSSFSVGNIAKFTLPLNLQ